MVPLDDTTPATRFNSFDIYKTSYKKIKSHEIEVAILVPKCLQPGKTPLLVRFHGGGLVCIPNTSTPFPSQPPSRFPHHPNTPQVTGTHLYPDWFAAFLIPFIHRHNAITVLPNYRLIPEHTGADIAQDLRDFWTWFHSDALTTFLAPLMDHPPALDYTKVLVTGPSAGGYLALMSGLTQPKGSISAVLAQYPMVDYVRREKGKMYANRPIPRPCLIDEHIAGIVPGRVVSCSTPPSRMRLSYALSAYGRYLEFFGPDKRLWPIYLIENKEYMPPTWIVHGDADTAVCVEDSKKFVEKCGEFAKGCEVRLEVRKSMEHGFDLGMREDEEGWLREGLKWVGGKWSGESEGKPV